MTASKCATCKGTGVLETGLYTLNMCEACHGTGQAPERAILKTQPGGREGTRGTESAETPQADIEAHAARASVADHGPGKVGVLDQAPERAVEACASCGATDPSVLGWMGPDLACMDVLACSERKRKGSSVATPATDQPAPAPAEFHWRSTGSLADAIVRNNADTADLIAFVSMVANHPDVGDSLTAVEREKDFQRRAREVLAGQPAPAAPCQCGDVAEGRVYFCGFHDVPNELGEYPPKPAPAAPAREDLRINMQSRAVPLSAMGHHVHSCPSCYEHVPCDQFCAVEPDLTLDDGTLRGNYVECGCRQPAPAPTAPSVDWRDEPCRVCHEPAMRWWKFCPTCGQRLPEGSQ